MATNLVEQILTEANKNEIESYKLVNVEKQVPLEFDLGHLLATDHNVLETKDFRKDKEEFLKKLARDNTQLIINQLWELETKKVENLVVAKLPAPKTILPRSKPIPKPKSPTKWELYAKTKGIQNRKREKLVWDDTSKEWKPRFGYRGINQNNDWLIEVPDNAENPNEDLFAKKANEKKERIAKNELQRLRNIARNQKLKVPGTSGIAPNLQQSKVELSKASVIAKSATASIGKFDETVRAEEKFAKARGKKRKFESNFGDLKAEREKGLKILEEMTAKKPLLNIDKAVESIVSKHKKSKNDDSSGRKRKGNARGRKGGGNKRPRFDGKKNGKMNNKHSKRGTEKRGEWER